LRFAGFPIEEAVTTYERLRPHTDRGIASGTVDFFGAARTPATVLDVHTAIDFLLALVGVIIFCL